MQLTYIGTKIVRAEPMTRAEWCAFRGWPLPANENGADEGYLVEYQDGGKPNVPVRAGYVSWSPKEQFDQAYRPTSGLSFGLAMEAAKMGMAIARAGWNGKGMFAYRVPGNSYPAQTGVAKAYFGEGGMVPYNAYMVLKGADGTVSTWAPSGSDSLADDWMIIDLDQLAARTLKVDRSHALTALNAGSQVDPSSALRSRTDAEHQLAPHQQRVVDEKAELLDKAEKLNRFFSTGTFNGLPLAEQQRMRRQLVAMYAYADILAERIAAF